MTHHNGYEFPVFHQIQDLDQRLAFVMEARGELDAAITSLEDRIHAGEVNALVDGSTDPEVLKQQRLDLDFLFCVRETFNEALLSFPGQNELDVFRPEWLSVTDPKNHSATAILNWIGESLPINAIDFRIGGVECFVYAAITCTKNAQIWANIRMTLDELEHEGHISFTNTDHRR